MKTEMSGYEAKDVRRNFFLVILITMISSAFITVCSTGTAEVYVQSYLQQLGFDASKIGLISSVGQIGSFMGCFLFVNYNTYRKGAIAVYNACRLALILIPLYLLITAKADSSTLLFMGILLLIKLLQQLGQSLHNIANTTMRRRILPVSLIARAEGWSNITNGALNVVFSAVFTVVISRIIFPNSYYLIFGIAVMAAILATILQTRYKPIFSNEKSEITNETFLASLKRLKNDPIIRALILPSILRSFSVCFAFIPVIASKRFGNDFVQPGLITVVTQMATVLGTLLIMKLSKRIPIGKMISTGAFVGYAALAIMCLTNSPVLFYAALFIAYVGQTQVDTGIPIGMQIALPEHLVGAAVGIRMSINSLCQAITLAIMGVMLDNLVPIMCVVIFMVPYVLGVRGFHKAFQIAEKESAKV